MHQSIFVCLILIGPWLMVRVFSVTSVYARAAVPGPKVDAVSQQPAQGIKTAISMLSVSVSTEEAERHLIGEPPIIRIKSLPLHGYFYAVIPVDVMVDKDGTVLWAVVGSNPNNPNGQASVPPEILHEAELVARSLRFDQFRVGGFSVRATFQLHFTLLPPELKPTRHVPVPPVKNWKSVKISLRRVGCFGFCPAYNLEVHGDGSVFYGGRAYVAVTGHQHSSVPRENIAELISILEHADFYSLRNRYGVCGFDGAEVYLSVEIEGQRKQVKDCEGESYGMPHSVRHVQAAIDRLSGAESWIYPNPFIAAGRGAPQR
jgi:hypothetical protein